MPNRVNSFAYGMYKKKSETKISDFLLLWLNNIQHG